MRPIAPWFYKIAFKMLAIALWMVTKFRYKNAKDPTLILLDHFSELQTQYQKQWIQHQSMNLELSSRTRVDQESRKRTSLERLLIVIPFRDQWGITQRCLASLMNQKVDGLKVKIILANNQSQQVETILGIQSLQEVKGKLGESQIEIEMFEANYPFNFSKINNEAVKAWESFAPTHLLFVNNDIEITANDFLLEMLKTSKSIPNLGVLGCTLTYPSGLIQHLFLAPGVKIVGAHPLKGVFLDRSNLWFRGPRPVAAVTGAVMMIQASVFHELNGFDELLSSLGQDLDLCLKAQITGRVNWVASHLVCIHAEGKSRGKSFDRVQVKYMYQKWGTQLTANDFFSKRLSRWSEYPVLSLGEGDYPWEKVL